MHNLSVVSHVLDAYWLHYRQQKEFVSQTFAKKAKHYAFFSFFLENERCKMREFFFYSVFGPIFFFFFFCHFTATFFHFFPGKKKKKPKIGLGA